MRQSQKWRWSKLLTNREQIIYEIGLLVSTGIIKDGFSAMILFGRIADSHNVPLIEIQELFDDLAEYTKLMKHENDESKELETAQENHGKKSI